MTIEQKLTQIKAITSAKDKVDNARQKLELHPDTFCMTVKGEEIQLEKTTQELIASLVRENLKAESEKLTNQAAELMK